MRDPLGTRFTLQMGDIHHHAAHVTVSRRASLPPLLPRDGTERELQEVLFEPQKELFYTEGGGTLPGEVVGHQPWGSPIPNGTSPGRSTPNPGAAPHGNTVMGISIWEHQDGKTTMRRSTWEHLYGNAWMGTSIWEHPEGNTWMGKSIWEKS